MQESIRVSQAPELRYLLRLGDLCLIHAQRLGEWCGHAPILEEDIALSNIALDLLGQARGVLTRAGELAGGLDEDQLAFLREERDYLNPTLVELPRGDFAWSMVRNLMVAVLLELLWQRLQESADEQLAAIAGKAVKEARYHVRHAGDWVQRLGDGTEESQRRAQRAVDQLWPYHHELFEADPVDEDAARSGLGPRWADLQEAWQQRMAAELHAATLRPGANSAFRSRGRHGVHSEHMGHLLAEMQYLQRAYPGGSW